MIVKDDEISSEKIKTHPIIRIRQCKHWNPYKQPYGINYCPKCNAIILGAALCLNEIEGIIEEVIEHEIIHWVLGKFISEEASTYFDYLVFGKK